MKQTPDKTLAEKAHPVPGDRRMAAAIITHAAEKLEYAYTQKLTHKSAPFLFEAGYEAMAGCVYGLMAAEGRKDFTPDAAADFLNEKYQDYFGGKLARAFSQYTGIYQDLIYRGVSVTEEQAAVALDVAGKFTRIARDIFTARNSVPA